MSITIKNYPLPLSVEFNIAVKRMQELYAPLGYVVVSDDKVPQSLPELKRHIQRLGGVIPVSEENVSPTIYGDPEVELMLRAWFVSVLATIDAPFTDDGMQKAFNYMIWQLISCYPYEDKVGYWIKLLHADLVGQLKHGRVYGSYPLDPRQFVKEYIEHGEIVFTGNPY
jgi:hypothetical protein